MSLPSREKAIKFSDTEYGSIGSIYITGGGFVNREFKGVSPNSSFGWEELVWQKTPQRGETFAFTNMDKINVGLVARCEIDVSFMTPDDYRDMRKILKQRHYTITFFDMDEQKWQTRDMYCTESSKSKFLLLQQSILGTVDVKLKFVGTNLDLETKIDEYGNEYTVNKTYKVNYIEIKEVTQQTFIASILLGLYVFNSTSNVYEKLTISATFDPNETYYTITNVGTSYGSNIKTRNETTQEKPSSNYSFRYWVTTNGTPYINGTEDNVTGMYGLNQNITIWGDLTFYPKFVQA